MRRNRLTLTYFSRSQRSNFDLFGAPSLILWFLKDNLWMPARILIKFGVHTYFIGASPGIGARQNLRIFNEAAALWLVETYGLITLFLIVGFWRNLVSTLIYIAASPRNTLVLVHAIICPNPKKMINFDLLFKDTEIKLYPCGSSPWVCFKLKDPRYY